MYKTVKEISSRYSSKEILELENRVDCYTWCYPIDFKEFDCRKIWTENSGALYKPENITLYIHVPYCSFICEMCPFTHIIANKTEIDKYVDALIKEIIFYSNHHIIKSVKVKSLYFGGGTASLLSPENISRIMKVMSEYFDFSLDSQITLECHPNTVNEDYLTKIYSSGINRVSFGLQSFNQRLLDKLNLMQNSDRNKEIIAAAKRVGFKTIAADIMYNFPTQTIEELKIDICTATDLGIENLSLYAIDPEVRELGVEQNGIEYEQNMFYTIRDLMTSNGYIQIAQPDYSVPGHENQQIIDLWGLPQTYNLGFGAGAFSESFNGFIWANVHNPRSYIEYIENGKIPILMGKQMSDDEQMTRMPALGVRMLEFNVDEFNKIFEVDFLEIFKYEIKQLVEIGYVLINENKFLITEKGRFYIDNISKMFFSVANRGKTQLWGCNLIDVLPSKLYDMNSNIKE